MLTIFIIQFVLAILAFVAIRNEGSELKGFVREYLEDLYNNPSKTQQEVLDAIHRSVSILSQV